MFWRCCQFAKEVNKSKIILPLFSPQRGSYLMLHLICSNVKTHQNGKFIVLVIERDIVGASWYLKMMNKNSYWFYKDNKSSWLHYATEGHPLPSFLPFVVWKYLYIFVRILANQLYQVERCHCLNINAFHTIAFFPAKHWIGFTVLPENKSLMTLRMMSSK